MYMTGWNYYVSGLYVNMCMIGWNCHTEGQPPRTLACSGLSGLCIAPYIIKVLCYTILSSVEMADVWGISAVRIQFCWLLSF